MSAFHIMTVCTGNLCRSPMAELLIRKGMARWPDIEVSSAGTFAAVGSIVPSQAEAISRRLGLDPSGHRARQVTRQMLRGADLVLAMARSHRRFIVETLPRASQHAFTLREFARLTTDVPRADLDSIAHLNTDDTAGRMSAAVDLAASRRGEVDPPDTPEDDDIVDPYGEDESVYEHSAGQLVPAAEATVSYLKTVATVSG